MSLDELQADMGQERFDLEELPAVNETIKAKVTRWDRKADARGRTCTYLYLSIKDKECTQKYSAFHLTKLVPALQKLKIKALDEMIGKTYTWRTTPYRIGEPRLIPE